MQEVDPGFKHSPDRLLLAIHAEAVLVRIGTIGATAEFTKYDWSLTTTKERDLGYSEKHDKSRSALVVRAVA